MRAAIAFAAVLLAPAVALACPSYGSESGCSGALSTYVSSVSFGLLLGIGSVFVENLLRRKS